MGKFMTSKRNSVMSSVDAMPPEPMPMSNDNDHSAEKDHKVTTSQRGSDPIAAALKHLHDAVADEPMPDSFMDLVAQIEARIDRNRA
jgi:hypothetical protein